MKKKFNHWMIALALLISGTGFFTATTLEATPLCWTERWYGVVSTGYAWGTTLGIRQPDPSSYAIANYNSHWSNSQFITLGIGHSFLHSFGLDLDYTFYQPFHYQRFQTPNEGRPLTRFFDLDHQKVILNFTFQPSSLCIRWRYWQMVPTVGIGAGVGINRMYNFHSISSTDGAILDLGFPHTKAAFAWQVNLGMNFTLACCPYLSFELGYRYADGGRFSGPYSLIADGTVVPAGPWWGSLRTNEMYAALEFPF